jgi:hypothetical protein
LVALVLTLFLAAAVEAQTPNLKFDDPTTPGGTVAYDGAGGAAIGTDILFQSITGLDTPQNAGVTLTCPDCSMAFTTGANISEGPPLWNFGPGGTITITGAIPSLALPAGTTLLSGSFVGTPNEVIGSGGQLGLFLAGGLDVKNETLAAFFGLDPTNFIFATTSIQTATTLGADGSFSGIVVNADLNNTAPVPGEGCLLRTPGFWGNHPHITSLFLPLTVCGVNLNTVEAGSETSATEAICSVGNDGQILGPQLTQLVRQCTAALLNVTASAVGGGNCPGDFPTLESLLNGCCGAESVCTGAPVEGLIQFCIDQLDAFNNSPDTLPPFDPFVSPGPADPSKCQDSRNNGVVVTPAP